MSTDIDQRRHSNDDEVGVANLPATTGLSMDTREVCTKSPKQAAAAAVWAEEHAAAIRERRAKIEADGTPLSDIQVLRID